MSASVELTVAQAIVNYLQSQHSELDGERSRLIGGIWGLFGHGNVASMSQPAQLPLR
jgi:3D-(3,5/4)-trihydroxycyclohexane-1,2-dione acylhydrolase (decyclizing)